MIALLIRDLVEPSAGDPRSTLCRACDLDPIEPGDTEPGPLSPVVEPGDPEPGSPSPVVEPGGIQSQVPSLQSCRVELMGRLWFCILLSLLCKEWDVRWSLNLLPQNTNKSTVLNSYLHCCQLRYLLSTDSCPQMYQVLCTVYWFLSTIYCLLYPVFYLLYPVPYLLSMYYVLSHIS